MHELKYVEELYRRVNTYARDNHAKEILRVELTVSRLSGIESGSFRFYWSVYAKNTILGKTKLVIRHSPSRIECQMCSYSFVIRSYDELIRCTKCGSIKTAPVERNAVVIQRIELIT